MAAFRKATGTVRADGRVIPHSNVFVYEEGTTNEIPVYDNQAGAGDPIDQPLVTNNAGRFSFFVNTSVYPTFRLFFEKDGIDFDQINEDLDGITLPGTPGAPGITWKGEWESGTSYQIHDAVNHGDTDEERAYICIKEHTGEEPPNAEYWDILAASGPPGPQGETGSEGPEGEPGLVWQGSWVSQGYDEKDVVEHEGTAYACIQTHVSSEEPPNSSYWEVLAAKGEKGDQGEIGINWRGTWASAENYSERDAVYENGSSYVCIQDHTSDSDNKPPDASYWEIMAQKGASGAGTGDVIGPSSSVTGNIASFADATGKEIEDSGVAPGDLATSSDLTGHEAETGVEGHIPTGGSSGEFLNHLGAWDTPEGTTYTAGTGLLLNGQEFSVDFGTESGEAAEGNHGHNQLHDRAHDIDGVSDHNSMTANRIIGRNGSAGTPKQLTPAEAREVMNVANMHPPIENKTENYSLVEADDHKLITMSNASARTITVPENSSQPFSVGALITILNRNTGDVTIVADGGVTIRSSQGLKLRDQWSVAQIWKLDTDEWVAYGDLVES